MTQNNKLSGKLELNWVNKNKTLIVSDYEKVKYEWVGRNDYRVSEVRLFKEMEIYSVEQKFGENASENLIICGDSLNVLTSLTKIPEYRQKYVNKVKLIYIDPPFNTGQMFANYDDQLEHSVWLTMMRDRVLKAYELLSDDGSLWVHLDDTELYHFKLVLDEIFGKENFVANMVWQKNYSPKGLSKFISFSHDNLLVFAKDYDEILGQSLREHLSKLDDLVILADEHHLYYGEKFSEAIRELKPKILIGLTGTPHEKTPSQEIIFRYRLGYALHDKLVKQPVLVGRSDSWENEESKLKDAITLLERKQKKTKIIRQVYSATTITFSQGSHANYY